MATGVQCHRAWPRLLLHKGTAVKPVSNPVTHKQVPISHSVEKETKRKELSKQRTATAQHKDIPVSLCHLEQSEVWPQCQWQIQSVGFMCKRLCCIRSVSGLYYTDVRCKRYRLLNISRAMHLAWPQCNSSSVTRSIRM